MVEINEQLIQRATEIYEKLPPFYEVPVDIVDGVVVEWEPVENSTREAAYDALEISGLVDIRRLPETLKLLKALSKEVEKRLAAKAVDQQR